MNAAEIKGRKRADRHISSKTRMSRETFAKQSGNSIQASEQTCGVMNMVDQRMARRQYTGEIPALTTRLGRISGPVLDPELRALLACAWNRAGLCVLMLLKRDPTACETLEGFHLRLRYPLDELAQGLESLVSGGVLQVSQGNGDPTYWLPVDSPYLPALQRLANVYHSGVAGRNCLVANLPGTTA